MVELAPLALPAALLALAVEEDELAQAREGPAAVGALVDLVGEPEGEHRQVLLPAFDAHVEQGSDRLVVTLVCDLEGAAPEAGDVHCLKAARSLFEEALVGLVVLVGRKLLEALQQSRWSSLRWRGTVTFSTTRRSPRP